MSEIIQYTFGGFQGNGHVALFTTTGDGKPVFGSGGFSTACENWGWW